MKEASYSFSDTTENPCQCEVMGKNVMEEEILLGGGGHDSPRRRPPVTLESVEGDGDKENQSSSSFTFTVRASPSRTTLQPKNNSVEEHEEEEEEENESTNNGKNNETVAGNIIQPTKVIEDCEISTDTMLENLELLKTIGTGTFGRVVLVQHKETTQYSALKILALPDLIRLKQVDHVKNEKNILKAVNHPFVVNMKWHGKDEYNIYMMLDYVAGGEMFSYLRSAGKFPSSTCAFYAAEIVLALEYLHSKSIVYRDLKPENVLIDTEGHLKLTDFGFAKFLKDRTWTLCGTPEYLAPEIIQSKGHNKAVDWWALGVLIYEMHCGYAPFYDDNNFSTYEKILEAKVEWPKWINPVAKDLMKKLLVPDRFRRLGSMKNGAEDVKRHRWFRDLEWEDVLNKRITPPIIPKLSSEGDTSMFDEYPEMETWRTQNVNEADLQLFDDF